jgi:hypothetical protein
LTKYLIVPSLGARLSHVSGQAFWDHHYCNRTARGSTCLTRQPTTCCCTSLHHPFTVSYCFSLASSSLHLRIFLFRSLALRHDYPHTPREVYCRRALPSVPKGAGTAAGSSCTYHNILGDPIIILIIRSSSDMVRLHCFLINSFILTIRRRKISSLCQI